MARVVGFLRAAKRHTRRLLDSEYRARTDAIDAEARYHLERRREVARLNGMPRYQATRTAITGDLLELVDAASFVDSYYSIVKDQDLRFDAGRPDPVIIDGGANIGVSVIYFKRLYPQSEVLAFEPDPDVFDVLQRNVAAAGCEGVRLMQRALWSSEGTVAFAAEGADAGRVARPSDPKPIQVPTCRLRDFLDRRIDFLKLDIEGAETEVLVDCADQLHKVERLYVEYHSFAAEPQSLHRLLQVLADAGFRVRIRPHGKVEQPFMAAADVWMGMDMQLDIFATR